MKPQTTNKLYEDTNINIIRLVYRDNFDLPFDPLLSGSSTTVEKTYNFLPVSGNYFSSSGFFFESRTSGSKLYKGTFATYISPYYSSFYYNYIDGTYVRVGMSISDDTTPDSFTGIVIINSINIVD